MIETSARMISPPNAIPQWTPNRPSGQNEANHTVILIQRDPALNSTADAWPVCLPVCLHCAYADSRHSSLSECNHTHVLPSVHAYTLHLCVRDTGVHVFWCPSAIAQIKTNLEFGPFPVRLTKQSFLGGVVDGAMQLQLCEAQQEYPSNP